jgi:hypothetical protein
MHVVAFAPAIRAVVNDAGGVNTDGFPMTSFAVPSFPAQITLQLVIAVYSEAGRDLNPRRYLIASGPKAERLAVAECSWHWPDIPGIPVKFRVMAHHLPVVVHTAGVYTVGLYDSPDATETEHLFPLPVSAVNPLLPPPSRPGMRL